MESIRIKRGRENHHQSVKRRTDTKKCCAGGTFYQLLVKSISWCACNFQVVKYMPIIVGIYNNNLVSLWYLRDFMLPRAGSCELI